MLPRIDRGGTQFARESLLLPRKTSQLCNPYDCWVAPRHSRIYRTTFKGRNTTGYKEKMIEATLTAGFSLSSLPS